MPRFALAGARARHLPTVLGDVTPAMPVLRRRHGPGCPRKLRVRSARRCDRRREQHSLRPCRVVTRRILLPRSHGRSSPDFGIFARNNEGILRSPAGRHGAHYHAARRLRSTQTIPRWWPLIDVVDGTIHVRTSPIRRALQPRRRSTMLSRQSRRSRADPRRLLPDHRGGFTGCRFGLPPVPLSLQKLGIALLEATLAFANGASGRNGGLCSTDHGRDADLI